MKDLLEYFIVGPIMGFVTTIFLMFVVVPIGLLVKITGYQVSKGDTLFTILGFGKKL